MITRPAAAAAARSSVPALASVTAPAPASAPAPALAAASTMGRPCVRDEAAGAAPSADPDGGEGAENDRPGRSRRAGRRRYRDRKHPPLAAQH